MAEKIKEVAKLEEAIELVWMELNKEEKTLFQLFLKKWPGVFEITKKKKKKTK